MANFATYTITTIHKSGTGTNYYGFVRHFETQEERDEYIATGEKPREEAPIAVNSKMVPEEGILRVSTIGLENIRA